MVLPRDSTRGPVLHIVQMGDSPLGLVGRDEANADHRAAARTAERRERRLGLAEGWNESETVRFCHAPLALRASKLATVQLAMGRLEVGEADSLLSSRLALPPWSSP